MTASASGPRFAGSVALITGGGGGIGRETARRFAAEGAQVAVVDLQLSTAEETVALITAEGGVAAAFVGDVTSTVDAERFVAAVVGRFGNVTILVNNAGGGAFVTMSGPFDAWRHQFELNLFSVAIVSKAVWASMIAAGGGVILNASSVAGRWNLKGLAAYCASKAGVVALTRALAWEGAEHKIRANCVVPGNVLTPALRAYLESGADPEVAFSGAIGQTSVGRLGEPGDIAEAYLYLASATWISGTDLLIDGGMTLGEK